MRHLTDQGQIDPGRCPADVTPLVIVVDDDPLVRSALDSLFRSVGYATRLHSNAREALDADDCRSLACIVTDIRMPDLGGFEFQAALAKGVGETPVIFMTGHADVPMSVRAMKAGAVDFLSKPFRDQDMLDAVSTALDRARSSRATNDDLQAVRSLYEGLTPREKQVMAEVVAGKLNKQIAGDLGIAEITVKLHRANLMRKLGVRTLPDLVRFASRADQG